MDLFRDWFPFIKAPILSSENIITNSICGCLTCHPFGKVTRDALHAAPPLSQPKPSQELKTISSLVDKFTVGRPILAADGITQTGSFNLKNTFNRHQTTLSSSSSSTCNRNRSFTVEMKHERFTPCELQPPLSQRPPSSLPSNVYSYCDHHHQQQQQHLHQEETCQPSASSYLDNYYGERRTISSEVTVTPTMKITSTRVISANNLTMTTNYEQSDVIVVPPPPPRRKKRTNYRKQYSTDNTSTDISLDDGNHELEIRRNHKNTELNNSQLDRTFNAKYHNNNSTIGKNTKHTFAISNNSENTINNINNNNNNNNNCSQVNVVYHDDIIKTINNKSGCSSVDVVSGILNLNVNNRSDNNTTLVHNNNKNNHHHHRNFNKNILIDRNQNYNQNTNLIGYCQNKVYYKDKGRDAYENNCTQCNLNRNIDWINGEEDEVLVCESIVTFEQQPPPSSLTTRTTSLRPPRPPRPPPPKDSTYTKFCTDSLYHDKSQEDEVSSSSFESQFEHISRLKSETGLMSTSPFTRFRVRKQKRARHSSLFKDMGLYPSVHHRTMPTAIKEQTAASIPTPALYPASAATKTTKPKSITNIKKPPPPPTTKPESEGFHHV